MSAFRQAWESLFSWVPPPLQVGLALVIALLIITKLAPRVIRVCGMALRAVWAPLLGALTYPEFLLTTAVRRAGRQPLPGTYAYGRTLGTLAPPGTRLGGWLASRRKALHFPWIPTLVIIAVLTGCWYLAPKVPSGSAQAILTDVNTSDVHVNTWLTTGQWTPGTPVPTCIPNPAHASTQPHKKKHKKKNHHRQQH
jgi:hypothetical protein